MKTQNPLSGLMFLPILVTLCSYIIVVEIVIQILNRLVRRPINYLSLKAIMWWPNRTKIIIYLNLPTKAITDLLLFSRKYPLIWCTNILGDSIKTRIQSKYPNTIH